jgi:hypothetical protein
VAAAGELANLALLAEILGGAGAQQLGHGGLPSCHASDTTPSMPRLHTVVEERSTIEFLRSCVMDRSGNSAGQEGSPVPQIATEHMETSIAVVC